MDIRIRNVPFIPEKITLTQSLQTIRITYNKCTCKKCLLGKDIELIVGIKT